MILAQTTLKKPAGFTLIEIIVATTIVALFTLGIASMVPQQKPQELTRLREQIIELANSSKELAISSKLAQRIHLSPSEISLQSGQNQDTQKIKVPKGCQLFLFHDSRWKPINKRFHHTWLISQSGIAEPLSLRCEYKKRSFEVAFDPLTFATSFTSL